MSPTTSQIWGEFNKKALSDRFASTLKVLADFRFALKYCTVKLHISSISLLQTPAFDMDAMPNTFVNAYTAPSMSISLSLVQHKM
jgi:hypothetical protein